MIAARTAQTWLLFLLSVLSTVLYLPLLDSRLNNHVDQERHSFTRVRLEKLRNEEPCVVPKTPDDAEWAERIKKTHLIPVLELQTMRCCAWPAGGVIKA